MARLSSGDGVAGAAVGEVRRLLDSRMLRMGAVVFLLLSLVFLGFSRTAVSNAQRELALAASTLQAAQQAQAQRDVGVRRAAAWHALLSASERADLNSTAWDERRFNIRQAPMTREAANKLVSELARTPDRLFSAEQFDFSVREPEQGIFTTPSSAESDLVVSLRGSMVFLARQE